MKKNFFIELMKKPGEMEYTAAYRSTLLEYSLLAGLLCLFIAGFGYIFRNDIKEILFETQMPAVSDFSRMFAGKIMSEEAMDGDKAPQRPQDENKAQTTEISSEDASALLRAAQESKDAASFKGTDALEAETEEKEQTGSHQRLSPESAEAK